MQFVLFLWAKLLNCYEALLPAKAGLLYGWNAHRHCKERSNLLTALQSFKTTESRLLRRPRNDARCVSYFALLNHIPNVQESRLGGKKSFIHVQMPGT